MDTVVERNDPLLCPLLRAGRKVVGYAAALMSIACIEVQCNFLVHAGDANDHLRMLGSPRLTGV